MLPDGIMDATETASHQTRRHALDRLWDTVEQRRNGDPETSYVASLTARHPGKPAQKVAEEAAEVVIEAVAGRRDGVVSESADLVFHLMVLLTGAGVDRDAVFGELAARMRASAARARRSVKAARRTIGTSKIP